MRVFRGEEWHFPLGTLTRSDAPIGTTVGFTDSIPLFALFFRVFSQCLAHHFQYFGLWFLLCYALIGAFGALLMRALATSRVLQLVGAGPFVINPVLTSRVIHPALCAHWLILAALWLYYRTWPENVRRQRFGAWAALLGIAALVNPYLLAMSYLIAVAYFGRAAVIDRTMSVAHAGGQLLVLAVLVVLEWATCGYITAGISAGEMRGGGLVA